ncbi:MAG: FtsX-like permease family protein [Oscillospiraceae bacterium]|nr:FtsX-like permease family protein [Oscillospiraceae bacterium]
MSLRQAFKMSLQSIFSNKVRAFLTMLGIIIGVAAVMIMVSVVQGGNQEMREYYESQGVNKINVFASTYRGNLDITQELYDYCLTMPELVMGVTPSSTTWGTVRYQTVNCDNNEDMGSPQIYLGSDQFSICNSYEIEKGRDLSYLDIQKYQKVVVLGSKLADYMFQAQNPVGKTISIGGVNFEVVGVYKAKGGDAGGSYEWMYNYSNYMAVVPYTANRYMSDKSWATEFTVKARNSAATTEAITRIGGFLAGVVPQNQGDYQVYTEDTWREESESQNQMMSMILGGIAGISLLVGGIGIMNIMLVTVTERTREIGIRKAIGGSRKSIILQFLIESSVLCGTGGVFGVILGYLGTVIAGKLILDMVLLPSLPLGLGAMAFSVILGVGFGMYPAIKASGLQPVDALRAD